MTSDIPVPTEELLPPYLPPRRPKSLPNLTRSRTSWHISSNGAHSLPLPGLAAKRSVSRPQRKLTKRRQLPEPVKALPPSAPVLATEKLKSRPTSYQSFSSGDTAAYHDAGLQRHGSEASSRSARKFLPDDSGDLPSPDGLSSQENAAGRHSSDGSERSMGKGQQSETKSPSRAPSTLASIPDGVPLRTQFAAPTPIRVGTRSSVLRKSSLRVETRLSDEELALSRPAALDLSSSRSEPQLYKSKARPYSHPASRSAERERAVLDAPLPPFPPTGQECWPLSSPPPSRRSTPTTQNEQSPRPRASIKRLSSLDHWLSYRDEVSQWKRTSSLYHRASTQPSINDQSAEQSQADENTPAQSARPSGEDAPEAVQTQPENEKQPGDTQPSRAASEVASEEDHCPQPRDRVFRNRYMEYGFILTVAMMQLLSEYLITGFAMELPALLDGRLPQSMGAMGLFWPAVLLTLIMGATLLFFARVSDIRGGYPCYMFGVGWLCLWTLVPTFSPSLILLDVARAMQGLAIAAFQPSTFAMIGTFYPEGPRRNLVMGVVAGCAPVGFFAGFLVAGALTADRMRWYWWTASVVCFAMFWIAFASVPREKTDRSELQLHMDWIGAGLITAGLVLLAFALSVEPYANQPANVGTGFSYPVCYAPFAAGMVFLLVAVWYEGWRATCPLLPFDFFAPTSVKPLALAGLFFYGSYGVWLYISAEFFQSRTGVTKPAATQEAIHGLDLALWYAPTAVGGIVLCVCSSAILHIVHPTMIVLVSAVAWLAAPLLLALAPLPLHYWSYVLPSMLCATIGLDLTYTISLIYLSSSQPIKYQGLSGAVASSLINLGMSFALPIAEIALKRAHDAVEAPDGDLAAENAAANRGYRAAFFYAAASAGVGMVICALCVRISRGSVDAQPVDEERQPRAAMSESTLVGEGEERNGACDSERSSQHRRGSG